MMTHSQTDYADLFFEHLGILREYAERVFLAGESLNSVEESDRAFRVDEFLNAGRHCDFTDEQLVRLLFAELLDA